MINELDVLRQSVHSRKFSQYQAFRSRTNEDLLPRIEYSLMVLVEIAMEAIEHYDRQRIQYNSEVGQSRQRNHLVPYVREKEVKGVKYLRFVWARLRTQSHRAICGHYGMPGIQEISPGKNGDYSEKKLNSMLTVFNKTQLPLLVGTEHVLRYCRKEYAYLSGLRRLVKGRALNRFQYLLGKRHRNLMTDKEEMEFKQMWIQLMTGTHGFEPFGLTVKQALVKVRR